MCGHGFNSLVRAPATRHKIKQARLSVRRIGSGRGQWQTRKRDRHTVFASLLDCRTRSARIGQRIIRPRLQTQEFATFGNQRGLRASQCPGERVQLRRDPCQAVRIVTGTAIEFARHDVGDAGLLGLGDRWQGRNRGRAASGGTPGHTRKGGQGDEKKSQSFHDTPSRPSRRACLPHRL